MHKDHFRKILIPILALAAATLACSQFTGSTPQPAATLNALYTSAGRNARGHVHTGRNDAYGAACPDRNALVIIPYPFGLPILYSGPGASNCC